MPTELCCADARAVLLMRILTDNDPWTGGLVTGAPVELKLVAEAGAAGEIEGYGATFHGVDHGEDTILPGAFAESIKAHASAGTAPAMLWVHQHASPIGKWVAMGEDARGLRVRGQLNLDTARGREAHAHIRGGDAGGLSIGYQIEPGGMKRTEAGRTISRVRLHEVSIVPVPMDPGARITGVKSLELKSVSDLRAVLRDAGLTRGAAEKIASAGWAALSGEPDTPTPDPAAAELARALERSAHDLSTLKGLFR